MMAAVLLCAGKGTRMNDNSINKVSFPCAGVPVIKRIINNLRVGGVDTFVVVVGHQAESVMEALANEPGVVYAYQSEQKGTGHAALCGLSVLKSMGYHGRVIITMGDKIVAPYVVDKLLTQDQNCKAVLGVQPLACNPNGGRVVMDAGKVYGIVELADAALMAIADTPAEERSQVLQDLGLNEKKAKKVLECADRGNISREKILAGKCFAAEDILATPYSNAGIYCLDVDGAVDAIMRCNSGNAQGEIYLTDVVSIFAEQDYVCPVVVNKREDLLTFSTKSELQEMSTAFYRTASEFIQAIDVGLLDEEFARFYIDVDAQKERYRQLVAEFKAKYGDKKIIISRSPGRINLMGRHIDHRGGSVNDAAINRDMVLVVSPRTDDVVNVSCSGEGYQDSSFSVSQLLALAPHENWLDYLEAQPVKDSLKASYGQTDLYVKSAILRFQLESNVPLIGMDIYLTGSVPVAVGLSSSSTIVVATAEAVCFLNNLVLPKQRFVELCGEGEWFVGSRGGAADHAAMKCCSRGHITHMSFKPFHVDAAVPFSDEYALLIANSMQRAKKSEGCKDKFNGKVATSDIALLLLKQQYPQYGLEEFRDVAFVPTQRDVYDMILSLPCKMTRQEAFDALPQQKVQLERIFASHADPGFYNVRGVALFGVTECIRAVKCVDALSSGNYKLLGDMMKISHQGDSVTDIMRMDDETIRQLRDKDTPLYLVPGAYECSTERIDSLCDLLNNCDGVLGTSLIGAGLGGCVVSLVEKDKASSVLERITEEFYHKNGLEKSADIYLPSAGSGVVF